MYAVSAVRHDHYDTEGYAWQSAEQLPTFYLDENVQGITDEDHAVRIARDILGDNVSITVTKV